MKVSINKKVFSDLHEKFVVGLIYCSNLDNSGNPDDIHEMLRDVEELIRVNFTPVNLKSHKLVSAWKAAVAHFGKKAKHYESNVELMMLDVLDGKDVKSQNKLVDLSNFMALKYIIPVGVTDAKKISKNLEFTLAKGTEKFSMGRKSEKVEKGELILRNGVEVLSRKFDRRVSSKGVVDKKTKKALVRIEALPPVSEAKMGRIVDEMAGLIRVFCGSKTKKVVLTKKKPSVNFP